MDTNNSRLKLFGIEIDSLSEHQVLGAVESAIRDRRNLSLGMVNAAKIVNMQGSDELRSDVMSSDIVVADGMSIVIASKLLRQPLPGRVAGIDLMHSIMRMSSSQGFRIFLLGATEEVSSRVSEVFSSDYPGAIICGRRHGYFTEAEERDIADSIKSSEADVLFVAMTSPRKERFMAKWRDHIDVPVVHGVGGSFDVVAGKVKRAPVAWQRMGMEWLYRLLQEPFRLGWRYIRTNSIFAWLLLRELFRSVGRASG